MDELIMSWLEDEESKFIFKNRLAYNESGDVEYLREIIDKYVPELKGTGWYQLKDLTKGKEKVWIWGGGINGRNLLGVLKRIHVKVCGIIDRDSTKTEVAGVPVFGIDKVDFKKIDFLIVSMHDKETADGCVDYAVSAGMKKENIALYRDYYWRCLDERQYFEDFIKYDEGGGEAFVDAGVLNLNTSLRFAENCDRNNVSNYQIYAFEPDQDAYQRCVKIREEHPDKDITLYNSGLWSSDTVLGFKVDGWGGSRIANKNLTYRIEVASLDSMINEKVTYIKMDIEGAELEALKGSQNIIRQYKPKLAVCVYHKKEDMIEIPRYIKSLVPEYRLYLRHYSNCDYETVLYALP